MADLTMAKKRKSAKPEKGIIVISSLVKLLMVLGVVVVGMFLAKSLYSESGKTVSMLETCRGSLKTSSALTETIKSLASEDNVLAMERAYDEHQACGFAQQLDDSVHFSAASASYKYHMGIFSFSRAMRIPRDYTERQPRGANHSEAEKMLKSAQAEYQASPAAKLKEIEGIGEWKKAKDGYLQLINLVSGKPQEYQQAFSKEIIKARENYINIESDQFKALDMTFAPTDALMNAASGGVRYTPKFTPRPGKAIPVYTIEISTEARSPEEPANPLRIRLYRDNVPLSLSPPSSALEIEANSKTAVSIIQMISTLICSGAKPRAQCAYVPIPGLAAEKTLLPLPQDNGFSAAGITFKKTPALTFITPATPDGAAPEGTLSFEAGYQGQQYWMEVLRETYPTSKTTITWKDSKGKTPDEHIIDRLNFASLSALCPNYKPSGPKRSDISKEAEEIVTCLASRQVFLPQ